MFGNNIYIKKMGILGTLINKTIDLLPGEMHLRNYNFCGPGTKLKKRLARGDKGINKLDEFCKQHDIVYSKTSDTKERAIADQKLADQAWTRVTAPDSSLNEKAAGYLVTNLMKAKSKFFGGGLKKSKNKKKNTKKIGKGVYLQPYQGSGIKKSKNVTGSQRQKRNNKNKKKRIN